MDNDEIRMRQLERIEEAAKDMVTAIIAYDRTNKTNIQDSLKVKTRKCIKKDL